jgi:hypothetical protein
VLLGGGVLGERVTDCDVEANPCGYYDIPDIRAYGWTAKNIARYGDAWSGKAVKIMYPSLINDMDQWQWIREQNPHIFVTIRNPLEQALSRLKVFRIQMVSEKDVFMTVTKYLYSWTHQLRQCVEMLENEYTISLDRVSLIDYQEHIVSPEEYCRRVAECIDLEPSEEQWQAAIHNIDDELYRFRIGNISNKYQTWFESFPACQIYRELSKSRATIWVLKELLNSI